MKIVLMRKIQVRLLFNYFLRIFNLFFLCRFSEYVLFEQVSDAASDENRGKQIFATELRTGHLSS